MQNLGNLHQTRQTWRIPGTGTDEPFLMQIVVRGETVIPIKNKYVRGRRSQAEPGNET
jgi:hypothetical protein